MKRSYQTRAEQETVIHWEEDAKLVYLWSASPLTWRKLARLGLAPTRETRAADGRPSGRFYQLPLAAFRWGLRRARRHSQGNAAALAKARQARGDSARYRESPAPGLAAGSTPASALPLATG